MIRQPTVLIVEDSRTQAHLFASRLREHDIDVLIAYDGEQGLRLAFEHVPDVIVLDVNLPGMNGYQVCKRLKRYVGTAEVPVFMLSAVDDADHTMEGLSVGADDYIPKDIFAGTHLLDNLRSLNLLPSEAGRG